MYLAILYWFNDWSSYSWELLWSWISFSYFYVFFKYFHFSWNKEYIFFKRNSRKISRKDDDIWIGLSRCPLNYNTNKPQTMTIDESNNFLLGLNTTSSLRYHYLKEHPRSLKNKQSDGLPRGSEWTRPSYISGGEGRHYHIC